MITQSELIKNLSYDPNTGVFIRKIKSALSVVVGQVAGAKHIAGYMNISINGKRYLSHRLAWLYMTGEMPNNDIDHINGDKTDNRFSNLRLATRSQNMMNTNVRTNNTSGFKGVSFDKRSGKWEAYAKLNYKKISFGMFDTAEEANEVRIKKASLIHGEYYRA